MQGNPGVKADFTSATAWLRSPVIRTRQQLRSFQDAFSQFLNGIQIEPLCDGPIQVAGSVTVIDQMVLSLGETSPTRCTHATRDDVNDQIVLAMAPSGNSVMQAQGHEWRMDAGASVFVRPGQMRSMVAFGPTQLFSVVLDRQTLSRLVPDVDARLLQPLRGQPVLQLIEQYGRLLRDTALPLATAARQAVVQHMHDLAALALGAKGDAREVAQARGVRAARLQAVRQDIAAHFSQTGFSVADVARRQGVSPRYLQMLLAEEGQSFSMLVQEARLDLARRLLANPRHDGTPISDVAMLVGFGDLSHFNRSFRRRFGMTPREARGEGTTGRKRVSH